MELAKQLTAVMAEQGIRFTFNGKPLTYEEVFSVTGLLPGLAKRADQLCSLCLGYGIGASYSDADKALLGVEVQFDDVTPGVLRLLCLVDVIMELVKPAPAKSAVALDELMYD